MVEGASEYRRPGVGYLTRSREAHQTCHSYDTALPFSRSFRLVPTQSAVTSAVTNYLITLIYGIIILRNFLLTAIKSLFYN